MLVCFVFRDHFASLPWPAGNAFRDSFGKSLSVYIASIGYNTEMFPMGQVHHRFAEAIHLQPVQSLVLEGEINRFRVNGNGCTEPSIFGRLLMKPGFNFLTLFWRQVL